MLRTSIIGAAVDAGSRRMTRAIKTGGIAEAVGTVASKAGVLKRRGGGSSEPAEPVAVKRAMVAPASTPSVAAPADVIGHVVTGAARGLDKKEEAMAANSLSEIKTRPVADLGKKIVANYNKLAEAVNRLPVASRTKKCMTLSSQDVSVRDLIAYQIGWGKCVIRWYDAGVEGKMPEMPGDGFKTFAYARMALHFYDTYAYDGGATQFREFNKVVNRIIEIVDEAHAAKNLDKEGVWDWCTLASGKEWPLSKWVQVNTVAPYDRAAKLIRNFPG